MVLLTIYLITVALGLIGTIILCFDTKSYVKVVLKEYGLLDNKEALKKIRPSVSRRIADTLRQIMFILTPVLNITIFSGAVLINRESRAEAIKAGIRNALEELMECANV